MAIRKSSNTGIPFGNTANRPANPATGQPYFNGELQRLELYTGATYGWQNIVAETPGVTGYTGTVIETNTTNTITIMGTNFSTGAIATLVGNDGTEYNSTSTTINGLTSLTATFGAIPANKEPYDIRVTNPSNLYGVYYDILTVNDKPIWTTAAGSLGEFPQGNTSYQFNASDEENNELTYSLVSGSLPTGLTLSSSGLVSGNNSGTPGTTYNFTISVSDSVNAPQSRSFSISVPFPSISGGSLTSDSTYYYRTFTSNGTLTVSNASISADYLIVAGGGGGGTDTFQDRSSGGGGAGGYRSFTSSNIPNSSYAITIGSGGAGGAQVTGAGVVGSNGNQSTFNSIVSAGGGGGAGHDTGTNYRAGDGGSGGGSTHDNSMQGLASPSGQGNNGGTSGQTGGGAGLQWLNGSFYAGGGAGSSSGGFSGGGGGGAGTSASGGFSGGQGGGGNSGSSTGIVSGGNGTANTGGGGGASRESTGGSGGSGIVIIRYTRAQVGG